MLTMIIKTYKQTTKVMSVPLNIEMLRSTFQLLLGSVLSFVPRRGIKGPKCSFMLKQFPFQKMLCISNIKNTCSWDLLYLTM